MIHIAVPDTQTLTEVDTGRKYEAYNLYVNGAYHASVRYSTLLLLHEKLQKIFGSNLKLAEFPAKKFFMDKNAIIERKNLLGTYFRSRRFYFCFDSFRPSGSNVSVDVYLPDGTFKTVSIRITGVRLLKNFESPYISLQLLNRISAAFGIFYRIVIRKMIWSPSIECTLFNNPGALNILYKQFLRLCHSNPSYGYEYLEDCLSDYPHPQTHCKIKIGRRCIVLEYSVFYATKIRSWTIAHVTDNEFEPVFEFDYCMSKEFLEKVTLHTKQVSN
uniref:SNX17_FERM_C domain-containing protein n=1 Tax=Syphacia muris TaxID=451379 RepID=A0A0N5AHD9_9BILA